MKKAFAIFLIIGATIFSTLKVWVNISHGGSGDALVEIDKGDTLRIVSEKLKKAGVISNPFLFEIEARLTGEDVKIRAGEYMLSKNASIRKNLERLTEGKAVLRPITIPEGYNVRQIGHELERLGFMSADNFVSSASDPDLTRIFNIPAGSAEGYLFPDTYHFSKGVLPDDVVTKMVKTFFDKVSKIASRSIVSNRQKLHRVVTLASIIEKETGNDSERALVAAVFANRLKRNMRLQSDPTVIYALPQFDGNIRKKDLSYDSPYNTYMYYGLPPGPIANPGLASISAALNPANVKYLYFVAKNNGEHYFSSSLKEHNRAVRKYQVQRKK